MPGVPVRRVLGLATWGISGMDGNLIFLGKLAYLKQKESEWIGTWTFSKSSPGSGH